MDTAALIAKGGEPAWQETFDHPEHGKLTFVCKAMPTGSDWLRQAMVQDALAPGLMTGTGAVLAAAAAGMQTIIEPPVIDEKRIEDPDNPDHVKIELTRYDPLVDPNTQFPIDVWIAFHAWRIEVLGERTKDAVKNSSGATSGGANDGSSPERSESPQTTLA